MSDAEINGLRALINDDATIHHIQEEDAPYFQEASPYWRVSCTGLSTRPSQLSPAPDTHGSTSS